jgi:hypothetical protein
VSVGMEDVEIMSEDVALELEWFARSPDSILFS